MRSATLRCSQGDCCVLANSKVPENIGRLVRILQRDNVSGRDWEVLSLGSPLSGVDMHGKRGQSMKLFVIDCQLHRLFVWPATWPFFSKS